MPHPPLWSCVPCILGRWWWSVWGYGRNSCYARSSRETREKNGMMTIMESSKGSFECVTKKYKHLVSFSDRAQGHNIIHKYSWEGSHPRMYTRIYLGMWCIYLILGATFWFSQDACHFTCVPQEDVFRPLSLLDQTHFQLNRFTH